MTERSAGGYVLVDKPAGMSSFSAAAAVRRALGGKVRTGHGGTLDPFATGLVLVLVGAGTKLMPHVVGHDKRYLLSVQFGARSTTDDIEGELTPDGSATDWSRLDAALAELRASTQQVPPQISALHVDGERAYRRARRGETMTLAPREVRFDAIEVVHAPTDGVSAGDDGPRGDSVVVDADRTIVGSGRDRLMLDVRCSTGTYMRALARDLGAALGTSAYASTLRRVEIGAWRVDDAVAVSEVGPEHVRPLLDLVPDLPRVELSDELAARFAHGQRIPIECAERLLSRAFPHTRCVVVHAGVAIGLADCHTGVLHPRTVFPERNL